MLQVSAIDLHSNSLKMVSWASFIAQEVKMFVAKAVDLSSIPGTCTAEG